ncbi:hypothetical protein DEO72_LG7g1629 [Vigna unguiculata]|uniref:Uncharacterized protein n=1 Tax=Vigna unguiculata TaxID=3917 RepID=A0A4D6MJG3_VIGUN|nr:hypothetical protein DEO72_LG7g1629 [Vigna unguiculata]
MPLKILDNVENLSEYNWTNSVHGFLVSGLNRGCKVVRQKQNEHSLNLAGAVQVVQVIVDWGIREEERKNYILHTTLHIEEEGHSKRMTSRLEYVRSAKFN